MYVHIPFKLLTLFLPILHMHTHTYAHTNSHIDLLTVSSLLLTPSLLAVGSYDGIIHIYDTPNLIDTNTSQILKPRTLHGHYNRIYGLHLLRGCIRAEGYSSLFPTFVGKSTKEMKKDFLVSIGFGRGYPLLKNYKVFKKSNLTRGSYVNSWML